MKITELKENQVVHCKTHEEVKRVLKLAHEAGMEWCSHRSYIENDNWDRYQEETCYEFTSGSFGDIPYYKREGYEIIPSEKITDMENKTEFFEERVMEVSDNNTDWWRRVVFGKKNGKYISWAHASTVEEAKEITHSFAWNYAREIDPLKELKEAWERGEDIQWRWKGNEGEWVSAIYPTWHPFYEYRIKPTPKYVPFDYSDAEKIIGRAVNNKNGAILLITSVTNSFVWMGDLACPFEKLLEDYIFLDGSPCGKEVEE